jgi:hypothetical protein
MRNPLKRFWLCVAAAPVLAGVSAASGHEEHSAHVHGQAQLTVATDGDLLEIMLESPAANLLGFEQKPVTEAQQSAWQQQQSLLKSGQWLQLPAIAQCVLQQQQLADPWGKAGQHADIGISLSYQCKAAELLNEVKVTLFTTAADLQQIDVQWVSGGQQGAATLSAKQPVLQLPGTE